ncbi:hypothetical protein DYI22_00820 [Marinobacter lipolyticus]|uniref:FimV/HubP family polar landmark protein n=1 Tax=Marinobacter lipolyticus TaxID=209639 RepID=UPI001BCEAECF|nr:FimV/HubP family polar landmark protein [Marinobacter lipolyticus]MBS8239043.1 hypothetical protein [Marinobacter lipolyticus]
MKVRKLAVALALAGGLGSGVAQALGLGEIELQSYLNEPLDAEINLRKSQGVEPGDVFVNIASENDYQRVGIDRNQFLTKLQFEVTTSRDGSLIVNVSSREPLREPYLNFLLEVTWPSGRLMREYAVLVDPPVYAEESGMEERVAAPATRSEPAPESRQQPARSAQRPADAGVASRSDSGPRTFGPTNASDTLWQIAASVRPDSSVSMQQVMLAIQDLNPDAFMDGNINRLKRGEVLRIPELDQIRTRSAAEANRQVAAQNEAIASPRRTVDATETAAPDAPERDAGSAGGDELRLIAADDAGSRTSDEGGSAGGDGQTAGGADAGSAVAMEELDSARRENQELNSRVEDLQDQVETLQRLLELKDNQLAEMQQMGDQDTPEAEMPESEEAGTEAQLAGEESAASQGESAEQAGGSADQETAVAEPDTSLEADEAGEPSDVAQAEGDQAADAAQQEGESGEPAVEGEDVSVAETGAEADVESGAEPVADADATAGEEAIADSASEETSDAPEPEAEEQPEPAPVAAQPATPAQQQDKGFPGNVIDAITNNPMYQIALGGGLVLLLLILLLLARRSANREKAFYEQLNAEGDDTSDSFDLDLEESEAGEASADEPLAEAETYIAYGQTDKAVETLEAAISREPSRTDLRLKLLGVYADTQDRASFEKQYSEIEALDDEQAMAEANVLRDRLDEAEAMPSIDDLESQLRSDSFGQETSASESTDQAESHLTDESLSDQFETSEASSSEETFETDFSEFDLGDTATEEKSEPDAGEESADSDMIEYDLSGLETESTEEASEAPAADSDSKAAEPEEDDLSFDFDESDLASDSETSTGEAEEDLADELSLEGFDDLETESDLATEDNGDAKGEALSGEALAESDEDLGDLDESFLDELDAELDKVAGEDADNVSAEGEGSSLDDLELDVSDEDLALMEEFADSGDSANPEAQEAVGPDLDEELDLEDALKDESSESPEELSAEAEDLSAVEGLEEELPDLADEASDQDEEIAEPPLASDALDKSARQSAVDDIDESDLGDDDDFDFLAGTDEAATKLDLARAYIEMGDVDGAKDILEEVSLEGNDEQKAEAQDLLKNLS